MTQKISTSDLRALTLLNLTFKSLVSAQQCLDCLAKSFCGQPFNFKEYEKNWIQNRENLERFCSFAENFFEADSTKWVTPAKETPVQNEVKP